MRLFKILRTLSLIIGVGWVPSSAVADPPLRGSFSTFGLSGRDGGATPRFQGRNDTVMAGEATLTRFEYTEYHMGVDVRMVVYAPDKAKAERACRAAFERFAELDTIMSDYRANSELMRLCARAGGPPVPVSKDLYIVLERSQQVAQSSEGAFDITCGPLVALWRKARKTHIIPAPAAIEQARALVGWQKLQLDPRKRTARLLVPGMRLDLGGIGKGYADDCAQKVLKKHGITHALIEAGGDIVVSEPPPGQDGWKIQVANADTTSRPPVLHFANTAISTSGDTEQFVEIDGKRYSHILDPRTGQALTDRIAVTIVARDGLTSDSLSTAVSVLGVEKGQELVKTYPGARAYIRNETGSPSGIPTASPIPGPFSHSMGEGPTSPQPLSETERGHSDSSFLLISHSVGEG